jgi:carbamoyl-phosphate synthase large subunit
MTYQAIIRRDEKGPQDFIIKPKYGFGSKNLQRVKVTDETYPIPDNYIAQEFIEGQEYTCDLVSDRRYSVVSLVARRREAVRGGEIQQGEIVNHLHMFGSFAAISKELCMIGPWCVQYILRDSHAYFIEINPRFGGGVPITARAGQDHALISLKVLERDFFGYHYRYLVEWGLTAMRYDECVYKYIENKGYHDATGAKRLSN